MSSDVSVTDVSAGTADNVKNTVCSQGDLIYVTVLRPLKVVRDGYAQVFFFR